MTRQATPLPIPWRVDVDCPTLIRSADGGIVGTVHPQLMGVRRQADIDTANLIVSAVNFYLTGGHDAAQRKG